MSKILVTGATGSHGSIGFRVVALLTSAGAPVRAMARSDDDRAESLRRTGAEVVFGDFMTLGTLRSALAGIDRVLFCYPLADGLLQATANLCVAARDVGIRSVVNISIMMAAEDHPSPVCRDHWLSEKIFDWANVGATHLRGGFFYENLIRFAAAGIARGSRIALPLGDGEARLAWVGGVDMAEAAASILRDPTGHAGKRYDITGDRILSIREIAAEMSAALGRSIAYSDIPLADWLKRVEPTVGDNTQLRRHLSVLAKAFGAGRVVGRTTDQLRKITGVAPQDFQRFVLENANSFAPHG